MLTVPCHVPKARWAALSFGLVIGRPLFLIQYGGHLLVLASVGDIPLALLDEGAGFLAGDFSPLCHRNFPGRPLLLSAFHPEIGSQSVFIGEVSRAWFELALEKFMLRNPRLAA